MRKAVRRVGFILDGMLPALERCIALKTIRPLFTGWASSSSIAKMRFEWIAECVNRNQGYDLYYELFRPWRTYHAVIFMKSMNEDCLRQVVWLNKRRVKTVFDANVDYFTPAEGQFYYEGMAPTVSQQKQAIQMASSCNCVIGDSRYIAEKASSLNGNVTWISDNVRDSSIASHSDWALKSNQKLTLLWCGEAVKLFELLKIEELLRSIKRYIDLIIITNSLQALKKIYEPWQARLKALITYLDCKILPFTDLDNLMKHYDAGGVFISPRFLENSYNLGHTEWKIALPMSRGRLVLCCPQQSYVDLSKRSGGKGIRICEDVSQYFMGIDELLSGRIDWQEEQEAACNTVRTYYSTSVVSHIHATFIDNILIS